jgi:hypothetical protein
MIILSIYCLIMLYITNSATIKNNAGKFNNLYLPMTNFPNHNWENKQLLIYFKSSEKSTLNGFYGYATVSKSIKKENSEEDELLYYNILDKYLLSEITNLYFMECESFHIFKEIIKIKKYNDEYYENIKIGNVSLFTTIIFDKTENMIFSLRKKTLKNDDDSDNDSYYYSETESESESDSDNCDSDNYDSDNNDSDNDDSDDNDSDSDSDNSNSNSKLKNKQKKKNENFIEMKIPILYIPCETLKNKLDTLKIKSNTISKHKEKCKKCEITNNNDNIFDLNNKITFSITNEKEFEDIVFAYQNNKNYKISEKEFNNNNFDNNKNNMLYVEDSEHYYDKCIFILIKN